MLEHMETVLVNNLLVIRNGEIVGNPFHYRLERSEVIQWVIENRQKVYARIKTRIYSLTGYSNHIDDCYGFLLDTLYTQNRLPFNKKYFGDDSELNIGHYCLRQVDYATLKYCKELYRSDRPYNIDTNITSHGQNNDMEKGMRFMTEVTLIQKTDGVYQKEGVEADVLSNVYEEKNNTQKLMWLQDYQRYFNIPKDQPFDILKYVYYMYLNVGTAEGKPKRVIHKQHKTVQKYTGYPLTLIESVTNQLRVGVKKRKEYALDFFDILKELVDARKNGWEVDIAMIEQLRREEEDV